MAEYLIQDTTLSAIAEAIRSKTGESNPVAVTDMADKISGIAADEKVETSVTLDFSEGDMEIVPEDGTVFSSVSIPTPTTLVPENIAEGVDIAGIVGALAGGGGSGGIDDLITGSLTEIESDAEKAGNYALYYNHYITSASFPNLKSTGDHFLGQCANLETVYLPNLETCGSCLLYNCDKLTEVSFPKLTQIGQQLLCHCALLTKVDFGCATDLGSDAFYNCAALTTVILRANTVVTVAGSSTYWVTNTGQAFSNQNAPNAYIYVPRAMLSAYQNATTYTDVKGKLRAIESYPEICG